MGNHALALVLQLSTPTQHPRQLPVASCWSLAGATHPTLQWHISVVHCALLCPASQGGKNNTKMHDAYQSTPCLAAHPEQ